MDWTGKHGVYLIAEIGGNHEGDFEYARQLTRLACDSGVDAVKFQIYTGDTLVSKVESPQRNAHFKRFELSPSQYIALAKECRERGVTFTASVWDVGALEWIDPYMAFYKIGSGDLTAFPILKEVASIGKPIILSTGLSTLEEVEQAVTFIQSQNPCYKKREYLALLQCTSMYPIPDVDANLRVMDVLRSTFQVAVGYSNHTVGADAVEVAVAMGAEVLEMHFTDAREGKTFRDHQVSFTQDEIKRLIEKIKQIKALHGRPVKTPTQSEIQAGHTVSFRRAVYPLRDLAVGTVLQEGDLTVLRPNHGIDARDFDRVVGRTLRRNVRAFQKLDWADLDG